MPLLPLLLRLFCAQHPALRTLFTDYVIPPSPSQLPSFACASTTDKVRGLSDTHVLQQFLALGRCDAELLAFAI